MVQTLVDYGRRIEGYLRKIKEDDFSQRNKDFIFDFYNHIAAEGLSLARQNKYLETLRIVARQLDKDFDKCTEQDIRKYIIRLNNSHYSEWTKYTIKVIVKRFYKWLRGNNKVYPEEVDWIKTAIKRSDQRLPGEAELLNPDDIKSLIEVAGHPRDKAFISSLYESGCRIGEIATLRICDVQADSYGYVIIVKGKTGSRRVRLVFSAPYLGIWLKCHPYFNYKDKPLWLSLSGKHRFRPSHNCFSKILKIAFNKAGIKKPCNPHHFRHSRATELANFLTEFQMNQYFGWVQGSPMPSTYVHLSGKEIDDTILAVNGIKSIEKKESSLKPRICQRCNTINTNNSEQCSNCFAPLDEKEFLIMEEEEKFIQEKRQFSDEIMDRLFADPEIKSIIARKIKEIYPSS